MQKIFFFIISICIISVCEAQSDSVEDSTETYWSGNSFRDVAYMPIYDSMGEVTFVRRSEVKLMHDPKNRKRIYHYDYYLKVVGYYDPVRKRFIKLKD